MKYNHECPEWDYLLINESMSEFHCCSCYNDEDAKIFSRMHSDYQHAMNELMTFMSLKSNMKPTPAEYQQLIEDNFWSLVGNKDET